MAHIATWLRSPRRVEVALAVLLLAFVMVGTSQIEVAPGDRSVDWLAFVCGFIGAASLVWWRRWTFVVAGLVTIAIGVYLARAYPAGPAVLPAPLAMLALGYGASRRVAWIGLGGLLAATGIGSFIAGGDVAPHLLLALGWGLAAVLTGEALTARGERAAVERERVAHAHDQALANERLRIAQDLHDSVAHAMATINVQSGVAAHLVEHTPEQAAVALEAIRAASSDALDELGSILGVLRDSSSSAPLAPLAGLGQIDDLVERARDDGLMVKFDQSGDVGGVSPAVGAAAYRAVQEALTNTRRHAGPSAEVILTVAVGHGGSLRIAVADDGGQRVRAAGRSVPSTGGFGLVGMRERVESGGGTLTVGSTPRGGYLVEATWPERPERVVLP